MKFCDRHYDGLKQAIKDLGLWGQVADSGQKALENALSGKDDPLMRCYWMITNRALEAIGLDLMVLNEDGTEKCPQCEYNKGCGCETENCADEWTTSASASVAKWLAEEQGRQA